LIFVRWLRPLIGTTHAPICFRPAIPVPATLVRSCPQCRSRQRVHSLGISLTSPKYRN